MFSTFATPEGSLIIRAIDIRSLADTDHGCRLMWEPIPGKEYAASILGSAEENLNRLKQEETEALIAAEKLRQRQSHGYPPDPIGRGKQAMRMVGK